MYEGSRTEPQDDIAYQNAVDRLAEALHDLKDFGTAWASSAGGVTLPAGARKDLKLEPSAHWRVLGSPALGVAILIGARRNPTETLEFLLAAGPGDEPATEDVPPQPPE